MNKQIDLEQLDEAINATKDLEFAPGESKALVPVETLAQDTLVANAVKLGADLIAIYQARVDLANAKLHDAQRIAKVWADEATKLAQQATDMDKQGQIIGAGFMKVLQENGVSFDGEL